MDRRSAKPQFWLLAASAVFALGCQKPPETSVVAGLPIESALKSDLPATVPASKSEVDAVSWAGFPTLKEEVLEMFSHSWVAHFKKTMDHSDNQNLSEDDRKSIAHLWAIQWETSLDFYNEGLQVTRKNVLSEMVPFDWKDEQDVHAVLRIVEPDLLTFRTGNGTIVFETISRRRQRMQDE